MGPLVDFRAHHVTIMPPAVLPPENLCTIRALLPQAELYYEQLSIIRTLRHPPTLSLSLSLSHLRMLHDRDEIGLVAQGRQLRPQP